HGQGARVVPRGGAAGRPPQYAHRPAGRLGHPDRRPQWRRNGPRPVIEHAAEAIASRCLSFRRLVPFVLLALASSLEVGTAADQPLILAFTPSRDPVALQEAGDEFARTVTRMSGVPIRAQVASDYAGVVDPASSSGYIYPMVLLIKKGLVRDRDPKTFFKEALFAGTHEAALQSVVHGRVDAAASFDKAPEIHLKDPALIDRLTFVGETPE